MRFTGAVIKKGNGEIRNRNRHSWRLFHYISVNPVYDFVMLLGKQNMSEVNGSPKKVQREAARTCIKKNDWYLLLNDAMYILYLIYETEWYIMRLLHWIYKILFYYTTFLCKAVHIVIWFWLSHPVLQIWNIYPFFLVLISKKINFARR